MILIYKFDIDEAGNSCWILVESPSEISDFMSLLNTLAVDGNMYRAELWDGCTASIVGEVNGN